MKKTLFLAVSLGILCLFNASNAKAYTFKQFFTDMGKDTRELYKSRPEIKGAYFFDLLDNGDARSKVGASISVLAWKFVTIDPLWLYTPDVSRKQGEYGVSFSLRPGEIPLGDGFKVKDMVDLEKCPEWLKRFYVGIYSSQNLQTGKFGFGISSGVKF